MFSLLDTTSFLSFCYSKWERKRTVLGTSRALTAILHRAHMRPFFLSFRHIYTTVLFGSSIFNSLQSFSSDVPTKNRRSGVGKKSGQQSVGSENGIQDYIQHASMSSITKFIQSSRTPPSRSLGMIFFPHTIIHNRRRNLPSIPPKSKQQ